MIAQMQSDREHMHFINEVVSLGQVKTKYDFLKKSV